jgi:hypothetical protein
MQTEGRIRSLGVFSLLFFLKGEEREFLEDGEKEVAAWEGRSLRKDKAALMVEREIGGHRFEGG